MAYPRKTYERVAESQTDIPLGDPGADGDQLEGFTIIPLSLNPGAVTLKDGAEGAAQTIFAGGAASVASLVPFPVWYPARSYGGGWKLSTGADVEVAAFGKFTA